MPRTLRPLSSSLSLAPAPLDFPALYGRVAPRQIDLGCGDGRFLVELARRHPEQDFLGIERLFRRSSSACRRAERAALTNVRILRAEIEPTLQDFFAPASVSVFHILFPDPWPKRRHHRRRLLQPDALALLHRCLETDGEIRFRTDDAAYFAHAERSVASASGFERIEWDIPEDYPRSGFELRFRERGLPIYSLRLTKR